MSDDTNELAEVDVVRDKMQYLRETPGACAEGNVHGWRNIRYQDGEWLAVKYASSRSHVKTRVEGDVLDDERVCRWMMNKPVRIIAASEAALWDSTIWEHAAQQDVFSDYERCAYCGQSERTVNLAVYQTTEDGDTELCDGCAESGERAGEIEHHVCEVSPS